MISQRSARSTRSSNYSSASPRPLQGILRRHHTTTTADYASKSTDEYLDNNQCRSRYIVRPAYDQCDRTAPQFIDSRSTASEFMAQKVREDGTHGGERRTLVRFSNDVSTRDSLPAVPREEFTRNGDESFRRCGRSTARQMDERYTDPMVIGLTEDFCKLTAHCRSVSDAQLYCSSNRPATRQQRVFGREQQQRMLQSASWNTYNGDHSSTKNRDQRTMSGVTKQECEQSQQVRRARRWSSFLARFTRGKKKSNVLHSEKIAKQAVVEKLNSGTKKMEQVRLISERPQQQQQQLDKASLNVLHSSQQVQQLGGRNLVRREAGRRPEISDAAAIDIHQDRYHSDYEPRCIRVEPPGYHWRTYPTQASSGPEFRDIDPSSSHPAYSEYDRMSSSGDSSSSAGYERIVDCKLSCSSGRMLFGDENEPRSLASPESGSSENESSYAPSSDRDVRTSTAGVSCSPRLASLRQSDDSSSSTTILSRFYPQSDYLVTSRSFDDNDKRHSICSRTAKPATALNELTSDKEMGSAPYFISAHSDKPRSELRSVRYGVKRSESDYVVNQLQMRSSSSDLLTDSNRLVPSSSTFKPKLFAPRSSLDSKDRPKLNVDLPEPPDSKEQSGLAGLNGASSVTYCDVTIGHTSLYQNSFINSNSMSDPLKTQILSKSMSAAITLDTGGVYDNLPWEKTAENTGGKLPWQPHRTIPTIVVESVPPESTHVTAVQNVGRDYVAIYAWSPEFQTVRSSPAMTVAPPVRSSAAAADDASSDRRRHSLNRNKTLSASNADGPHCQAVQTAGQTSQRGVGETATRLHDFTDVFGVDQDHVTDSDIVRIEMFYRSNKTEVFVCACVARLYRSTAISTQQPVVTVSDVQNSARWFPTAVIGVPVIVIDSGESRCRDRKLYVLLADVHSGCSLWRDVIDHLSDYRAISSWFHVMRTSRDHTRLVGLLFANDDDAGDFRKKMYNLTSGPSGDKLLSLSGGNFAKGSRCRLSPSVLRCTSLFGNSRTHQDGGKQRSRIRTTLKKSDISAPCCFEHVSTFNRMPAFLLSNNMKKSQSDNCFQSGCLV
jgi:hypothetical protein